MTSASDILRPLSRSRLDRLAAEFAPWLNKKRDDDEMADGLGEGSGSRLLEMLATLDGEELADICEALDLTPGDLARIAAPPETRGDCVGGLRPCPYSTCRYHVHERRSGPVCSLDIADYGGEDRVEVARILGVTPERVRQIEAAALAKLGIAVDSADMLEIPGVPEFGTRPAKPVSRTMPVMSYAAPVPMVPYRSLAASGRVVGRRR